MRPFTYIGLQKQKIVVDLLLLISDFLVSILY
jgi:hypothetical protein